jgi:hypothetical protein
MKIKIPLVRYRVSTFPCDRPEVTLWVRTRYDYIPLRFHIDTGADCSAIPMARARREGIEFPSTPASRGTAASLLGSVDRYLGSLHVRIAGEEFDWPCSFLSPPTTPALIGSEGMSRSTLQEYAVLGRAGFLIDFALPIDGDYLTLTRRHSHRPWWYRAGRKLWPELPRRCSHWEPL